MHGVLAAQGIASALALLVDSTGNEFLGKSKRERKKLGAEYWRQRCNCSLASMPHTLEIRPIEVTDSSVGNQAILPGLLGRYQLTKSCPRQRGSACDTEVCHGAAALIWLKW